MFFPSSNFLSARLEDFISVMLLVLVSNSIDKFYQLINSDFQSRGQTKNNFSNVVSPLKSNFLCSVADSIEILSFTLSGHGTASVQSLMFRQFSDLSHV